nr:hypothetical protein [Tanacetum cinerariifolium]
SSSKLSRDQTSNPTSSTNPTPKGRIRRSSKQKVENSNFEEHLPPVATMTDNHTMAEKLRAPIEGCAEAIVVSLILAEQFELKHSLIDMMTSEKFFELEKDNLHDHIRWFNKITSTIKYKDVPNSVIKLILFPFSLVGAARRWLKKEPPRSITTWDDLVSKFINEFFPPSRTTNLRNEISNFQQKFDESFHEAWEGYKDLLCACPHHGFTELHQLDTFYNALNLADQDSLNAAAGGNLLEKSPQDALTIIENKSKVRNSRSKPIASPVNACDINSSSEIAKLTHAVNQQTSAMTIAMTAMLKQLQANPPPAQFKAVEEICVTCGGARPYYQCLAAGGNTFPEFRDNIQGYVSTAAGNYNQGNPSYHPQGVANQMRPQGFAQPNVQNNQNRFGQPQGFNRGTNFNQEQPYQATTQSNQNFHLNELEKTKRMNDTSLSNQTNEIKNMMASLLQMNTASTSGSRSLPGNTIANPKSELKAITTRSGLVTDGPIVPTPPKSVTPEEDGYVEETYTDPNLAEYTIKVPPPPVQKPKPPVQRNFVLHTRDSPLPNIPELKCKALADLGASINLMPLSVWKKLGLPDLIPTCMTLELTNREICTPDGIAKDVFVLVGKFTFPADFVVVDYESDPKVPLILGRPFLRTARTLINVHSEEMILRDGDERLTLNMKHDTTSYSNHPHIESANLINIFNVSSEDFLEDLFSNQKSGNPTFSLHKELTLQEVTNEIHDSEGCNFLSEEFLDIGSFNDIHPYFDDNPLSGSTTYSSNSLLEDFTDELALITYPPDYDDNLKCDIESNLREIEFLLYQEIESDADNFYDDPFDSKGEKIKESKLLIDELDLPCDFFPYSKYDSFNSQDFSRDDDLPSPDNEDKDSDPPFYEDVANSMRLLPFSSENEEKVFKPRIYTSEKVKERQEKDKIGSKPNKNGKPGEDQKSQSQSQSREE